MRIAVTGPDGFIAWHLRCAIRANWGGDAILVGAEHFAEPAMLRDALAPADAVIHLAGVNRGSDEEVRRVNPWLAEQLSVALHQLDHPIPVIYANSIHADSASVFGDAKRAAAATLSAYGSHSGAPVADVMLPNVFGEHGLPFYNSVVATFCHLLARGESPRIDVDRPVPLLHAQQVAELLLELAVTPSGGRVEPAGREATVSDLLAILRSISDRYRTGELPDLSAPFIRDLFNTYRSFTFPSAWPVPMPARSDVRGDLFEAVRGRGGETQVFFSTTRPTHTRGQHFHLHKVERFVVLRGLGEIRLRRLFHDETVTFAVSGERPVMVDMPTMWVHSITNTGSEDLVTLFFADTVHDPAHPDTYPEDV